MAASRIDYHRVFDASPNPYMVLDARLRYVAANQAYLAIVATSLEALLGRTVPEVFPHDLEHPDSDNTKLLMQSFARVLATRTTDTLALIHYRVPSKAGGPAEDRYWSATHTPVLDDAGDVQLIVQHTVDVTEVEKRRSSSPLSGQVEAGILRRAQAVQAANLTLGSELSRTATPVRAVAELHRGAPRSRPRLRARQRGVLQRRRAPQDRGTARP